MSRHAVLLVVATLSIGLVSAPAQALQFSGRDSPSVFVQLEDFFKLLLDRFFGVESRAIGVQRTGTNEKIGSAIEPYGGAEPDDAPPLDGIGSAIEPYG